MFRLGSLSTLLELPSGDLTTAKFLEQHRRVEAYLRRLLLIALRRKGVSYGRARLVAEGAHFPTIGAFLKKTLELLGLSDSFIRRKDPDFRRLQSVWLEFCCPHRNLLTHGGREDFPKEDNPAPLLFHVNYYFVSGLNSLVAAKYSLSPLDNLKGWKLPRGVPDKDDGIVGQLGLAQKNIYLPTKSFRAKLEGTAYALIDQSAI